MGSDMLIFDKPISRYLALTLTFTFALMDMSMAQNNNWQRQQQQQQMANQQRQQQQQEFQRQQQRAQIQESARQQARERQQRETRAAMQGDIRARESQRVRNETTQRLRTEETNKVRNQVRNDAANTARQNYRDQASQGGKRGTAQSGNTANRSDKVVFSNGIAKLTRPLTPGEAKRGFTGKLTGDGRALVKFQGRVFAVPAARVGIKVPKTETSGAALATSWSPQKQASISGAIQKLATGGEGGGSGGKPPGSAPCDPRKSLSCNFNTQAAKPGVAITALSPGIQARIDEAQAAKRFPGRLNYSADFERDQKEFRVGFKKKKEILEKEMVLVQYHDANLKIGEGRSAKWWTSHLEGNKITTVNDIHQKLALPQEWGERGAVSIAKIPAGTEVEYIQGGAANQTGKNGNEYTGGGEQFRFKTFDPAWIIQTRKIENGEAK